MLWGVKAYRGPKSITGPRASWVGDGDHVIPFPDEKSASFVAQSLNRGVLVPYVRYVAEPIDEQSPVSAAYRQKSRKRSGASSV